MKTRRFKITYELITPESAIDGDIAEHGWEDEVGEIIELDDWDIEDGLTIVDVAVDYLQNQGVTDTSASPIKYMDENSYFIAYGDIDVYGEVTNYSYHPVGFTVEEIQSIAKRISE